MEGKKPKVNINHITDDTKKRVKIAAGDKSLYNFISTGGVVIAGIGVGLMFTGIGLPVGLGIFGVGGLITIGAGYKSHQSQEDLDSLKLTDAQIEAILEETPQIVIPENEDSVKPGVTIDEEANLSSAEKKLESDKSVYNFISASGLVIAALGIGLAVVTGGASLVGLFIGLGMIAIGGGVALGFDSLSRQAQNELDKLPQREEAAKERPRVVDNGSVPRQQVTKGVEETETKSLDEKVSHSVPETPKTLSK